MAASNTTYPPAWTGYRRSVTIDGNAYEQLEYQFCSRRRKLTIHRRHALDDRGLRRRRFSRTLEHVRSGSVKNLKVISSTRRSASQPRESCSGQLSLLPSSGREVSSS